MWNEARWLKLPKEEIENKKIYHGDMTGRLAYFRQETQDNNKPMISRFT